jgi:hypothetical protein
MKAIDLGRRMDGPTLKPEKSSKAKPEKHYPSVYIEHDKKLDGIPDEGTMTIRHRVTKRATSTDKSGKERHELHFEIQSIEGADGDPGEGDKGADREDALDKLANEEADKE